jgi:competence protein ComEA
MKRIILSLAALILSFILFRLHFKGLLRPDTYASPLIVEVQGPVKHPGVYYLEGSSVTVAHAVAAAGGITPGSGALIVDISNVPVHMGERITLYDGTHPDGPRFRVEPMEAAARLTLGLKLDLNRATMEELCLVPQMKPVFATAIVEHRRKKAWSTLRELESIPGIGERTVEKWKEYLSVGRSDER